MEAMDVAPARLWICELNWQERLPLDLKAAEVVRWAESAFDCWNAKTLTLANDHMTSHSPTPLYLNEVDKMTAISLT